jgi:hypothetical protein
MRAFFHPLLPILRTHVILLTVYKPLHHYRPISGPEVEFFICVESSGRHFHQSLCTADFPEDMERGREGFLKDFADKGDNLKDRAHH